MPARNEINARLSGAPVALAKVQSESPWNVLAYEVALKGRGSVVLARVDFAQCVANFERWGREVPVVLYHADTKDDAHPASRAAHAWITAMRVGAMQRNGATVATLEARFRWVNEATRAQVESGELAYGSVTLVQRGTDEETGADVGSYLWSFSLTNNPALVDIPRIAAERDSAASPAADDVRRAALTTAADAVAAVLHVLDQINAPAIAEGTSSTDSPSTNGGPRVATESSHMAQMMTLAARLGIAVASEDDASAKIAERAQETADVRRALNLTADAKGADVAAKIAELSGLSVKVAALSTELDAAKAREAERVELDVASHLDAMIAAQPALKPVRASLEFAARADFAGFVKANPLPKASATVTSTLTQRVTALAASVDATPSNVVAMPVRHNDAAGARARELMAADNTLTLEMALKQASREIKKAVR